MITNRNSFTERKRQITQEAAAELDDLQRQIEQAILARTNELAELRRELRRLKKDRDALNGKRSNAAQCAGGRKAQPIAPAVSGQPPAPSRGAN